MSVNLTISDYTAKQAAEIWANYVLDEINTDIKAEYYQSFVEKLAWAIVNYNSILSDKSKKNILHTQSTISNIFPNEAYLSIGDSCGSSCPEIIEKVTTKLRATLFTNEINKLFDEIIGIEFKTSDKQKLIDRIIELDSTGNFDDSDITKLCAIFFDILCETYDYPNQVAETIKISLNTTLNRVFEKMKLWQFTTYLPNIEMRIYESGKISHNFQKSNVFELVQYKSTGLSP